MGTVEAASGERPGNRADDADGRCPAILTGRLRGVAEPRFARKKSPALPTGQNIADDEREAASLYHDSVRVASRRALAHHAITRSRSDADDEPFADQPAATNSARCCARCSLSDASRSAPRRTSAPAPSTAWCTAISARKRSRSASARRSPARTGSSAPTAAMATASPRARDLDRMMAELYGREAGYCKGKGGSMHIADFGIGMLGANGIVGGRHADRHRRGPRRAARGQGGAWPCPSSATARRSRAVPRVHQHRGGLEAAGGLRLREQPVRRADTPAAKSLAHARCRRAGSRLRHPRRHRRRQRRARRLQRGDGSGGAGARRRRPDPDRVQDLSLAPPIPSARTSRTTARPRRSSAGSRGARSRASRSI